MDVKGRMMDVAERVDGRLGRFKWHDSDALSRANSGLGCTVLGPLGLALAS